MPSHAAFLRAMNLGDRRITNEELCALFETLGFEDVEAFLASGNVVFSTKKRSSSRIEELIEEALFDDLDYEVPTFVRTLDEVAAVANETPFSQRELAASDGDVQVLLLAEEPPPSAGKEALSHATDDDRLALRGAHLFWLPKGNLFDSDLDTAAIEAALGTFTIRNLRTLQRLRTKFMS